MEGAVERHFTLLREAIECHKGVLLKTVGDAVQAAFSRAPDALLAAIAAQRALVAEDWRSFAALPVRTALHAGTATPLDNDYLAPSLNRLSRLLIASHGGQIVLTETVRRLLDGVLPPDTTLRDMGSTACAICSNRSGSASWPPDLPADLPPPAVAFGPPPHNLPTPPTPPHRA